MDEQHVADAKAILLAMREAVGVRGTVPAVRLLALIEGSPTVPPYAAARAALGRSPRRARLYRLLGDMVRWGWIEDTPEGIRVVDADCRHAAA